MQTPRFAVHGLCAALLALCAATAAAQSVGIAYYDVDHLYDTIPALFYDDSDYTPEGRLAWDTERYRRKIDGTAAVIDSMSLPIVALWGVENEAVVRDLAAACRGDYVYLHRTLNTLDGMDFALLYHGDRFFPTASNPDAATCTWRARCTARSRGRTSLRLLPARRAYASTPSGWCSAPTHACSRGSSATSGTNVRA